MHATFQATCILASSGWYYQNVSYGFAERKKVGLIGLQKSKLENLHGSNAHSHCFFHLLLYRFFEHFYFNKLKSHHFKFILLLKFCGTYGEYDQYV